MGGMTRLTNAIIDTLQNYFGIALRQNVGNLDNMTKAIMASLYHVSNYHDSCPKTSDTWCQYQKDKREFTKLYKPKSSLPVDIRKAILPVYTDLTKPELLVKCLHGKTQNANESFNGMIWNRVPKATHILTFGVYDAIAHFNYGAKASLDILKLLNVEPGIYMTQMADLVNKERKQSSSYRMSDPVKKRRKVIRHRRKKKQDTNIEAEGTSYEAGGF